MSMRKEKWQARISIHGNKYLPSLQDDTALLWAANRGHVIIVELLIKAGANVNDKNNNVCLCLSVCLSVLFFCHVWLNRIDLLYQADCLFSVCMYVFLNVGIFEVIWVNLGFEISCSIFFIFIPNSMRVRDLLFIMKNLLFIMKKKKKERCFTTRTMNLWARTTWCGEGWWQMDNT